jgi:hypothetical protein
MSFFMEQMMACLNGAFVNKQGIGLKKYKRVMESKFLVELNESSQYNEPQNSKGFSKWFECKISDVTTKLLQWVASTIRRYHQDHFKKFSKNGQETFFKFYFFLLAHLCSSSNLHDS